MRRVLSAGLALMVLAACTSEPKADVTLTVDHSPLTDAERVNVVSAFEIPGDFEFLGRVNGPAGESLIVVFDKGTEHCFGIWEGSSRNSGCGDLDPLPPQTPVVATGGGDGDTGLLVRTPDEVTSLRVANALGTTFEVPRLAQFSYIVFEQPAASGYVLSVLSEDGEVTTYP